MQSKYGVSYDFSEPYETQIGDVVYRFTSMAHKAKFDKGAEAHVKGVSASLARRFKVSFTAFNLALIHWYRQCETRGFYIIYQGEVIHTPTRLAFNIEMQVIDGAE